MALIKIKTGNSTWTTVIKPWIKTASSTWTPVKTVWMKLDVSGWAKVWPLSGPYAEDYPYITTTASGSTHVTSANVRRTGTSLFGRNTIYWNENGWGTLSYTYTWKRYGVALSGDTTGETAISTGNFVSPSREQVLTIALNKKYLSFGIRAASVSNPSYFGEAESGESEDGRIYVVQNLPDITTYPDIQVGTSGSASTVSPSLGDVLTYSNTWSTFQYQAIESNRTLTKWYRKSTAPSLINNSRSSGGGYYDTTGLTSIGSGLTYTVQESDVDNYIFCNQEVFNSGSDYDFASFKWDDSTLTSLAPGEGYGMKTGFLCSSKATLPKPVGTAGTVTFSRDSISSYNYSITSVGTWTNTPTSYRYQWFARTPNGINPAIINGATSSTFDATTFKLHDIFPIVWASNSAGESNTGYPSPLQSNYPSSLGAIRSSSFAKVYYKAPVINSFSVTGGSGYASYSFSVSADDPNRTIYLFYYGPTNGFFSVSGSGSVSLSAGTYEFILSAENEALNGGEYSTTSTVANIVVTAPVVQYTITFNPNGGNAVAEPIVTVTAGESVYAPLPTRSGYTFSRWRNPPSGDLMYTYYAGDTFTPTESFTLTAIWILNVAPSGGSVTITGTQKINNTLTANVTNASGYPTPTYTYKWRRGVLIGGVLYFSDISGATSSTYALVSADVGYYIRVEVTFTNGIGSDQMAPATTGAIANLAQYTITFNPNGGNAVAEPIVTVTEGESVYAPLPTRSGYTFSRWRNPPSGDLMYTYYAGDTFTPTESFTLTAIWTLNVTPVVPNVTPVIPVVPNVTPVVPVVPVTPNVTTWYGSACCTSQFSDFGIQATRSSQAEVFNALDAACLGYMYNVQYSSVTYPADPCGVTPVVPVVPNVTPVVPVVPVVPNVTPVVPDLTPIVPVLPSCTGCFYGPIDNFGFQSICCYDVPACTYSCFSL